MGLSINKSNQSSGRSAVGEDFYSGLMLYGTAPSVTGKWASYTSSLFPSVVIKAQQLFSIDDATSAGILPNTDNTASTATYLITHIGADLDTVNITCITTIIGGGTSVVNLGTYTVNLAVETTIALQGAALAAVINAGTYSHGFTASFTTATLTITAPKSLGKYLNTGTPYVVTLNTAPTIAGTLTQNVIAGTASQFAIWYYQISEYFRKYPTANVWVGVISATSSFNEILALQNASGNKLRRIGVLDTIAISTNMVGNCLKLQTAALLLDQSFAFEAIYSPNISAVADLSAVTMPNGQLVAYNKVSVIISQDQQGAGGLLYTVSGQSIGNIGIKLATSAINRVSADDSQPIELNNLSDGTENNIPGFANGQLLSAVSTSLQTQLSNYRYIFHRTFTGNLVGTFWNGNWTYCVQTNRYAYENDNFVASKITRILNTAYLPKLSNEVIFNQDGTISSASVELLQDAGVDAITAGMITGFGSIPLISGTPIVTIDPTQDLQNTNNLQIVVQVGENGIARNITISQGFSN